MDEATLHATMGHLLLFNPRGTPTHALITVYFEHRDPARFNLTIPAKTSRESNFGHWPVEPGESFALEVRSDAPLIAQSTRGWTNTGNDYSPRAVTHSPRGRRETARSSMAIPALADYWFVADAIVIDLPKRLWIRESEWALLLNPANESTSVSLQLYFDGHIRVHEVEVGAGRLRRVFMDSIVDNNRHYGVEIVSERPIAAQWLRQVKWINSEEEMTSWSVPAASMQSVPR